jgi:hypothetical protein
MSIGALHVPDTIGSGTWSSSLGAKGTWAVAECPWPPADAGADANDASTPDAPSDAMDDVSPDGD